MSSTRYGVITHTNCVHKPQIRFESPAARDAFREKFDKYHASHDHDGGVPTFRDATASEIEKYSVADATDVTLDGWKAHQIRKYHEDTDRTYVDYKPPTCCVAPTIAIDDAKGFRPSDEFERQELSAIFGDMPDDEFQSLCASIETDGIVENIIKIYEGQILDGWHRYRACRELNLLRKLRFQVWNLDEHRDGDPKVFVLARNMERRHLNASQRAQIAVTFNERFGHGTNRWTIESPNGNSKTREELAKRASVGTRTIDRAVVVEKAGRSEEVIRGENSASAIISEITVQELSKQLAAEMTDWKQRHEGVSYASKSTLIEEYREQTESDQEGAATAEELKGILKLMREDSKSYALGVRYSNSDERKTFEAEKAEQSYQDASKQMWQTLWEKKAQVHAQNFITAACDAHLGWGVDNFPKNYASTDIPGIWEERFSRITSEILTGAEWVETFLESEYSELGSEKMEPKSTSRIIDEVLEENSTPAQEVETDQRMVANRRSCKEELQLRYDEKGKLDEAVAPIAHYKEHYRLDEGTIRALIAEVIAENAAKVSEQQESEPPAQTAEEREANKRRKQQKHLCKLMWDTRKEVTQFYLGDEDTDLNLSLSLPELERGFARNNSSYEADFNAALHRTSFTSLNIVTEKTIEADTDISILEREFRALQTYRGDIFNWQCPNWSPDTNWILPLIQAKQKKASKAETSDVERELSDNLRWMWETFERSDVAHLDREDFAVAAAKASGYYVPNAYESMENYLLRKDFALFKNLDSLKDLERWKKRINDIQTDIQKGADWVLALYDESEDTDEIDENYLIDYLTIGFRCEVSDGTVRNTDIIYFGEDEGGDKAEGSLDELPDDLMKGLEEFLRSWYNKEQDDGI